MFHQQGAFMCNGLHFHPFLHLSSIAYIHLLQTTFISKRLYLPSVDYLLTCAHRSRWSILFSGLLWPFQSSWSLACSFSFASVSHPQLLRGRPLFLFPCGFQARAWLVMLNAGCLRVCPIQPHFLHSICLVTGSCPTRSTDLHFGSSPANGFCRCSSDWCWRMSGSFDASSVLSAVSHVRRAGKTSHWSWRYRVWFLSWFLQMPTCFWIRILYLSSIKTHVSSSIRFDTIFTYKWRQKPQTLFWSIETGLKVP